mgnify:CR=1 FL=1
MSRDGIMNLQAPILRDLLTGALIANGLKKNYEALSTNQYLQNVRCRDRDDVITGKNCQSHEDEILNIIHSKRAGNIDCRYQGSYAKYDTMVTEEFQVSPDRHFQCEQSQE